MGTPDRAAKLHKILRDLTLFIVDETDATEDADMRRNLSIATVHIETAKQILRNEDARVPVPRNRKSLRRPGERMSEAAMRLAAEGREITLEERTAAKKALRDIETEIRSVPTHPSDPKVVYTPESENTRDMWVGTSPPEHTTTPFTSEE